MQRTLKALPPLFDLETRPIMKKAAIAHRYLAELKGVSATIPNQTILLNTLSLQEAKDSSAIENIITTHDDLFREDLFPEYMLNASAKEVSRYAFALKKGFALLKQSGLLTANHIIDIHSEMEMTRTGFRRLPGTELRNLQTGEIVYIPPQDPQDIISLMNNLERFINDNAMYDADPLIKMAVLHFQFESIHPFYDGNGRTGRILNVLYMVQQGLLDIPVLYLSRYIVRHKALYYRLLQKVRENDAWEEWVLFILDAVISTSKQTIQMVEAIRSALIDYKHAIRAKYRFYSHDLINNLFFHPYTNIEFVMRDLGVSRHTATKYLDLLCGDGLLEKHRISRSNYYVNKALFGILTRIVE